MAQPLGQKLKAAREQRGLSLLDAQYATKIPVQRLHFLETDNFAGFGSLTYARAFLRRYSDYLKVNAEDMLDDLPGGVLGGPRDYRYLTESHGSWVSPRNRSVGRLTSQPTKRHTRKSPVPAGLCIFFLVLVGTGIWGKYVADDRISDSKQKPEAEVVPVPRVPAKSVLGHVVMEETQAVTLTTNAQVPRSSDLEFQVLKAVPLSSEDVTKLNVNIGGKEESVD